MFILINLKTYVCDPIEIAKAANSISNELDVRIAVAPQVIHLKEVVETGVETWAQHIDKEGEKVRTGTITSAGLSEAGVRGIVNINIMVNLNYCCVCLCFFQP